MPKPKRYPMDWGQVPDDIRRVWRRGYDEGWLAGYHQALKEAKSRG